MWREMSDVHVIAERTQLGDNRFDGSSTVVLEDVGNVLQYQSTRPFHLEDLEDLEEQIPPLGSVGEANWSPALENG